MSKKASVGGRTGTAPPPAPQTAKPVFAGRRTPIRTCVACRTSGGKRGLLRVVRLPEGAGVTLDPTGKQSGRGAYVCAIPECVATAQKRKAFERSLKVAVGGEVFDALREAVAAKAEMEVVEAGSNPEADATIAS